MKYILSLLSAGMIQFCLPALMYASESALAESVANTTHTFDPSRGIFMAIVMIIVVALIASEAIHRTLVVFFGASVLILLSYTLGHFIPWFDFLSLDAAFRAID